jgi:hypothetical protein
MLYFDLFFLEVCLESCIVLICWQLRRVRPWHTPKTLSPLLLSLDYKSTKLFLWTIRQRGSFHLHPYPCLSAPLLGNFDALSMVLWSKGLTSVLCPTSCGAFGVQWTSRHWSHTSNGHLTCNKGLWSKALPCNLGLSLVYWELSNGHGTVQSKQVHVHPTLSITQVSIVSQLSQCFQNNSYIKNWNHEIG